MIIFDVVFNTQPGESLEEAYPNAEELWGVLPYDLNDLTKEEVIKFLEDLPTTVRPQQFLVQLWLMPQEELLLQVTGLDFLKGVPSVPSLK
jgi:hypothetical protein